MRGGRGRPLPKFFGILAFEKVVQVVQIMEGGGQGNLDKIQKNSFFFRESVPYPDNAFHFPTGNEVAI